MCFQISAAEKFTGGSHSLSVLQVDVDFRRVKEVDDQFDCFSVCEIKRDFCLFAFFQACDEQGSEKGRR
jgi:hypothetical protein